MSLKMAGFYDISTECLSQLRPEDSFITTYPASGTAVLTGLITAALMHTHDSTPDNPLVADWNVVRLYHQLIPGIHRWDASVANPVQEKYCPAFRLFKSHNVEQVKHWRQVYLFRAPADCIYSYYVYLTQRKEQLDPAKTPLPAFVKRSLPQWIAHLRSALDTAPGSHFRFMSFYKLKTRPEHYLPRILEFLDLAQPQAAIDFAVEANDFSRLQALESQQRNSDDSRPMLHRSGSFGEGESAMGPGLFAEFAHEAIPLFEEANRRSDIDFA